MAARPPVLTAVAKAGARIVHRPQLGHRRPELLPDPLCFYAVNGFPYLLIYNTGRPGAPVARVLHMARDLGLLLADLPYDKASSL